MSQYHQGGLMVSTSPHIIDNVNTTKIMRDVIISLAPAFIMSAVVFGPRAVLLTVVCVASCVAFEALFRYITKRRNTIGDLSAVVTGVLLSFNLPSNLPYWMAVIGSFVAIVIVKQLFGGIGQNFANPAITARVVLLVSFTTPMTTWPVPEQLLRATDAVTGATPLALFAAGETQALPSYMDLFIGTVGGSLGETSALALLLGGAYLLVRKIITPHIPLAFLGTVALFSLLVGEDPLFQLLSGGVMLGAIFMATDYATSPLTAKGKIVFGIGCGLLTMVIRLYGSYPEGVSYAILLMNILSPHIDNLASRKLYGGIKG